MKKKLIMNLILTAIMISIIIPTVVWGVTENFYPREESYWTGSVEIGGTLFDNSIYAGTSGGNIYRGFATFDIGSLPANAGVTRVILEGNCIGIGGPAHGLEIKRLDEYPPCTTAATLSDAIKDGLEYGSASSGMRTAGANSRTLSPQAWTDLETAAQSYSLKWFAVGLTEKGENDKTGLWDGWSGVHPPYLRVTYSVPVQTAPTVSTDTYSPCANTEFNLSWASIAGVDGYEIKKGNWSVDSHWFGHFDNAF